MADKRKTHEMLLAMQSSVENWVVLVVDNESDNLIVVEKVLSYYGARVITANDGTEALKALETVSPTLILLDLSMPHMDGWETLEHIRANPKHAAVPVIALTAHAMDGDKDRVLAAGFDHYITKPFRISTFFTTIQDCLREIMTAKQG